MSLFWLGFLITGLTLCLFLNVINGRENMCNVMRTVCKQPYRYGVKFTGFHRRLLQKYSNSSFTGWLKYSQKTCLGFTISVVVYVVNIIRPDFRDLFSENKSENRTASVLNKSHGGSGTSCRCVGALRQS